MIYKDERGYLVTKSLDGGDTAVREGLMATFGQPNKILDLVTGGICVRNPWQPPWNNPNNFTIDQLKCLVAGLYSIGRKDICEQILKAQEDRGYFAQNCERDWPGSTKLTRPHCFYKDSKPDNRTILMDWSWSKFGFEIPAGKIDKNQEIETKYFDHADLLRPNDWEFLKVAAGRKAPGGIGLTWHHAALTSHIKSDYQEQCQMYSECVVMGTKEEFKKTRNLDSRGGSYWGSEGRLEIEYHLLMMKDLGLTTAYKAEK